MSADRVLDFDRRGRNQGIEIDLCVGTDPALLLSDEDDGGFDDDEGDGGGGDDGNRGGDGGGGNDDGSSQQQQQHEYRGRCGALLRRLAPPRRRCRGM